MNNEEYNPIEIPTGDGKDDIKIREEIISEVYRKWYENNPSKSVYNADLKTKPEVKNQSVFTKMLIMECPLIGIGTAKLTVGVKKKSGMKIQYCITALGV